MEAVRVKLLVKVENLVCRILRSFSTVIKGGVTSTTSEGSAKTQTCKEGTFVCIKEATEASLFGNRLDIYRQDFHKYRVQKSVDGSDL